MEVFEHLIKKKKKTKNTLRHKRDIFKALLEPFDLTESQTLPYSEQPSTIYWMCCFPSSLELQQSQCLTNRQKKKNMKIYRSFQ